MFRAKLMHTGPLKVLSLLALATLLCPTSMNAQFDRIYDTWRWAHFTEESGLPSNRVFNVVETGDGQVWAHTSHGLAWFDGFRWIAVSIPNLSNTDYDGGTSHAEDSFVTFWTRGGTFAVDRNGSRQIAYPPGSSIKGPIYCLDPNSFITKGDTSLFRITGDSVKVHPSPIQDVPLEIRTQNMTDFQLFHSDNSLWLKVQGRFFRWSGSRWDLMLQVPGGYLKLQLLRESRSGDGIAILEDEPGTLNVYEWSSKVRPHKIAQEQGDLGRAIGFSPDGDVIILELSGELRIRQNMKWTTLPPFPPPIRDALIVRFRANGDLWVGTENGLYLCRLSSSPMDDMENDRWRPREHHQRYTPRKRRLLVDRHS